MITKSTRQNGHNKCPSRARWSLFNVSRVTKLMRFCHEFAWPFGIIMHAAFTIWRPSFTFLYLFLYDFPTTNFSLNKSLSFSTMSQKPIF